MAPIPSSPAFLSVQDIAARFQVSTKTVRRLLNRGDIPVQRVGRQIRVSPDDLALYLTRSRQAVSTRVL